jgi:hypothetical protein
MKHLLLVISLIFTVSAKSQNDTLNRTDAEGKKDRYWLVYLDEKLIPVSKEQAVFYAYEHYQHGAELFVFSKQKWKSDSPVEYSGQLPAKGSPVLLNGTFKRLDPKTKLITSEETYSRGMPIRIKEYAPVPWKSDSVYVTEELCFDITCNSVPGTYQLQEHYQNGLTEKFWFRNGEKGWKIYPCLNFDCQEDEIMYLHSVKDAAKTASLTGDLPLDIELMTDSSVYDTPQTAVYHGFLMSIDNNSATFSVTAEDFITRKKNGKQIMSNNLPEDDQNGKGEVKRVSFDKIASVNYLKIKPISNVGGGIASVGAFAALVISPIMSYNFSKNTFNTSRFGAYLIPSGFLIASGLTLKYTFRKSKHYYINRLPAKCKNCERYTISDK